MPRFEVPNKNGTKSVYGFDQVLGYYFVDHVKKSGFVHLVGLLGKHYGSARNALECLNRLGAQIPAQHREQMMFDLPLTELTEETEEVQ